MNPLKVFAGLRPGRLARLRRAPLPRRGRTEEADRRGRAARASPPTRRSSKRRSGTASDYDGSLQGGRSARRSRRRRRSTSGSRSRTSRHAADILRPVYERQEQRDGFVSLEVSPYLAMDTDGTVEEARRLWRAVERENLMVKVPATAPGLPAIRTLTRRGHQRQRHPALLAGGLRAGRRGLSRRPRGPRGAGRRSAQVASVASFFVSRIDTAVDKLDRGRARQAQRQRRAAPRSRACAARSRSPTPSSPTSATSASSPAPAGRSSRPRARSRSGCSGPAPAPRTRPISDVLYVEELIGADTVNTMPPATMDAFRDHGRPRASLEEDRRRGAACHGKLWRASASRSTTSPPSCSRTASSCSPTPQTSCSARSRASAPSVLGSSAQPAEPQLACDAR